MLLYVPDRRRTPRARPWWDPTRSPAARDRLVVRHASSMGLRLPVAYGARIAAVAGEATDALLTYYKRRDQAASPSDRLITALTASNFGVRTILLAERKAARARAPVWMYRFDWETPAFGGRLKAPHSVEVPFVFDTLYKIGEQHRKPRAQALADRVSKTWASFARGGDPASDALPAWPTYTAERRATMLLDDTCKVVNDPEGDVRPLWSKVATG